MEFRWNDWNLEHATGHGVYADEAEEIVRTARPPWPERPEDGKFRVWGKTGLGRHLQVVYVVDSDGTLYVIHARPLNDREKTRYRKRIRARS